MIIIYGGLRLGGIETHLIRVAEAYYKNGKDVSVVLLSNEAYSDPELIKRMRKVSRIYFISDLISLKIRRCASFIKAPFLQQIPSNNDILNDIFDCSKHDHIHVCDAHSAILACEYMRRIGVRLPISIGVYHSKEYFWGWGGKLPYFERINRHLFLNVMPRGNILLFNDNFEFDFKEKYNLDFKSAETLFIPIPSRDYSQSVQSCKQLRITTIGRFANFKTYQLWMLDVISELVINGFSVIYDIYGYGSTKPLIEKKINELGLASVVSLKGALNYNDIELISSYDLFIGSGSTLLEVSSMGVPSIIGVESIEDPLTYGFFTDVKGTAYNEKGLYPLTSVYDLIVDYILSSEFDKLTLKNSHYQKCLAYGIDSFYIKYQVHTKNLKIVDFKLSLIKKFFYAFSFSFSIFLGRFGLGKFSKKYMD